MPRRIEIELTSSRDDSTWTWRAAGAREPKGVVSGSVLPTDAKVGDVLKVEAEFFVDGIEITSVVPTKSVRKEVDRLELLPSTSKDEPLVTTTLAPKGRDRGPRRDGRDGGRRDRPERERRDRGPRDGDKGDRRESKGAGKRREGGDRPPRRTRPEPPPMPAVERPKAKRLRAGKTHRNALLESLPEEQRPVAEQVVLGGLPAVRQAIEKQNAERSASGEAAIPAGPLIELAEKLVPKVRAAEWRDRAEAAQRDLEVLDLRDLRSVVSTADARDAEARALVDVLKDGLARRVDAEHAIWLDELKATLDVGRIVRALRVSSRPPKAGAPLPPELATRLAEGAGAALTADAAPERWVAVLDALAFAPVRDKVIPASLPAQLHDDVKATIARLATRIPKIAHIFEIAPDRNAPRPKTERRRPKKATAKAGSKAGSKPESKDETAPPAPEAAPEPGPEPAPEPAPESTPEPTPEADPQPAAEAGPEPAPEAAAETEPEAASPSDSEAPSQPAPAAGADAAEGTDAPQASQESDL